MKTYINTDTRTETDKIIALSQSKRLVNTNAWRNALKEYDGTYARSEWKEIQTRIDHYRQRCTLIHEIIESIEKLRWENNDE